LLQSSCCTDTDNGEPQKTFIIESFGSIISHLTFIQLSKRLDFHLMLNLYFVNKTKVHAIQAIILLKALVFVRFTV